MSKRKGECYKKKQEMRRPLGHRCTRSTGKGGVKSQIGQGDLRYNASQNSKRHLHRLHAEEPICQRLRPH